MSTTITGKLNKPAHQFTAGESVGFGIRLGVRYYDRDTKQKEWTNYECAIFARQNGQVKFYQDALIEGAIVTVTGKSEKIKQFQGQNGLMLSIELLDASLDFIAQSVPQGGQPQQAQPPQNQQPAGQQPQGGQGGQPISPALENTLKNSNTGFNDSFDSDIPF